MPPSSRIICFLVHRRIAVSFHVYITDVRSLLHVFFELWPTVSLDELCNAPASRIRGTRDGLFAVTAATVLSNTARMLVSRVLIRTKNT
jgi:hypothetical protein